MKYIGTYITCRFENEQGNIECEDFFITVPSDGNIATSNEELPTTSDAEYFSIDTTYYKSENAELMTFTLNSKFIILITIGVVIVLVLPLIAIFSVLCYKYRKRKRTYVVNA